MTSTTEGSERKTDRLEAFSDAVLAIAITLPVVDLKAPERSRAAIWRRPLPALARITPPMR